MQQSLDTRECLITANWLVFKQDMSASRKMIGDLTDFFPLNYIYIYKWTFLSSFLRILLQGQKERWNLEVDSFVLFSIHLLLAADVF